MKDKYLVKSGYNEFPASEYQIEIFKKIEKGVNNLIINASAGSSKTTTLVNAIRFIPEKKKILFVAFNKDIVEKIRSEAEHKNVNVCTFHSLGFSILLEHLARACENKYIQNQDLINIDIYKYNNYLYNNIDLITRFKETKSLGKRKNLYVNNIKKLIDYCRYYLAFTIKEITRVGGLYGIVPVRDEYEVVRQILLWGKENISSIDYTDMIWLPNVLNLTTKSNLYDWIFIDEAQDTSIAEQELVERCFRRGTKFVAVGDDAQCQPSGTKILMCDGSEKNIEDIKVGDEIVTYADKSCSTFIGYKCRYNIYNRHVTAISKRRVNKTILIETKNGLKSEYSLNHLCYCKFNWERCKDKYILYLMCNEDKTRFRIGTTRLFNPISTNTFGLKARMRSENCTYGWILKIYDDLHQCHMDETLYSLKYDIPQIIFEPERAHTKSLTKKDVVWLYENLGYSVKDRAEELLIFFDKDINFPFADQRSYEKNSRDYMRTLAACNLFKDVMDVKYFDKDKLEIRTHGKSGKKGLVRKGYYTNIIDLKVINEQKIVYSLNVEKEHNYVADGILTHNCINIWAGSTEEAIERFQKHPNTITSKLPISYRCPKKVIELAKQYSDNIMAYENAIEGEVNYDVSIYEPKNNDMVLCRTTAPLIELHLNYLRCNKKSFIRGSENIRERFTDLINSTQCTLIDKNCITSDGLIPRLYTILFDEIEKLKFNGLNDDDAITHPSVLQLYDDIEAICVLSEGITNVDDLLSKINTVFMGDENDAIVLSTVHKAKGLEADNIFIYYPSLMPLKLATKDWEVKTEDNLIYVAYTRAKKTLNFMKEDKYNHRMNGYFNIDKMKAQLKTIKEKIQYNKELGVTEKNYEYTHEKPMIKLGEENKVRTQTSKKNKAGIKMRDLL